MTRRIRLRPYQAHLYRRILGYLGEGQDANDRLSDNVSALDVRKVAGVRGTFNRYGVRRF